MKQERIEAGRRGRSGRELTADGREQEKNSKKVTEAEKKEKSKER